MFVIPKAGYSIVDPQRSDVLPPEGRDVGGDHDVYWGRRVADGDVTAVAEDKIEAAKTTLERADALRASNAEAARVQAEEAAAKKQAEAAKPAQPAPVTPAPAPKK